MTPRRQLGRTAIIPPNLYVERAADWQLWDAILSMESPPYVLVARQMGKTNLLLHAKRCLERSVDLYMYFDLSVRFSEIRAFFRYVVDSMLKMRSSLTGAKTRIEKLRSSNLPPSQEYELSLLDMLVEIPGRLVIFFDEVDLLVGCPFADQIFSEIRSMYFERANYGELQRLTYVLSGVAEPSDLIRDRTVSPFNIGEKVYLDDFSKDNLKELALKASLSLNSAVLDRVFFWTQGHPRMIWDICSELETVIHRGITPAVTHVDATVEDFYLKYFNNPPIDHIRTLVENDVNVRDAVLELKRGNAGHLEASTSNRLYLAGIIGLNTGAAKGRIKNRIIDAALGEKWLHDVSFKLESGGIATVNFAIDVLRFSSPHGRMYEREISDDDYQKFTEWVMKYDILRSQEDIEAELLVLGHELYRWLNGEGKWLDNSSLRLFRL